MVMVRMSRFSFWIMDMVSMMSLRLSMDKYRTLVILEGRSFSWKTPQNFARLLTFVGFSDPVHGIKDILVHDTDIHIDGFAKVRETA